MKFPRLLEFNLGGGASGAPTPAAASRATVGPAPLEANRPRRPRQGDVVADLGSDADELSDAIARLLAVKRRREM